MALKIKDYFGYAAYSDGRIIPKGKNTKSKFLKPWKNIKGYELVTLMIDGKRKHKFVHHVVLECFIGPPPKNLSQARHLNGDKLDNRIENLRWGTCLENVLDRRAHGTARVPVHRGRGLKSYTKEWK